MDANEGQVAAVPPSAVRTLASTMFHTTHPIGSISASPVLRTIKSPPVGGRVVAVHVQSRGGGNRHPYAFGLHVCDLSPAGGGVYTADITIARLDTRGSGWEVNLEVDAIWVVE